MSKHKHILVIRLSAMGDVAMTVPVLRAFGNQYPNTKLTILTRAQFAPMFTNINNLSVFSADLKGRHKGFLGLWKLSKELKKLDFDAVADLHNVLRTKILKAFFTGKEVMQINKGRKEKKALTSGKIFQQLKSTHQRYADVFDELGFNINLSEPSFPNKRLILERVKCSIETTEIKTKKWIGVAPFAAYESKMYPLDKIKNLIEILSKNYKVFLFGGGDNEISFLQPLADTYKNVISLAGKLSLEEELDVISNLDVMLSMDSGNGHLAAIFGVNVITIWGATHPFAGFKPFNQSDTNQLLADRTQFPLIPTSIYGNKCLEGYKNCAESIALETILEKINSLVQ